MFRRLLNGLAAVAGAASASQFPAFYQQYMQRLGGRLDQAQIQVARIEAAARDNSLTVAEYVEKFAASSEPAHQRQGDLLLEQIIDLDRLRQAMDALAAAPTIARPWRFAQYFDGDTARATLGDFAMGLPLTTEGFVYAAIGMVIGLMILAGLETGTRRVFRQRRVP